MSNRDALCIFGEVLFDHFPDGARVLGGAPFNVAWHLQAFGRDPYFISRVGADPEGETVLAAMREWGMETRGVQRDPERPTGRVDIRFVDGEPKYDIVHPCAYDAIEIEPDKIPCRLLYHGSLALRDGASRNTVQRLKQSRPEIIFLDVNLRPPWWQRAQVLELVKDAHWVKLNDEELALLVPADTGSERQPAEFVAEYGLQGLVLTRGSHGAEVLTAGSSHFSVRPDPGIDVIDTVGAGDAFAAVMILGLASGWPLETTLQRGQSFASRLVGMRGATVSDPSFYQPFLNEWKEGA